MVWPLDFFWHVHPTKTQIGLRLRAIWSVFVVRKKKFCIIGYPTYARWRLWRDCEDVQADLNLRWPLIKKVNFWRYGFFLINEFLSKVPGEKKRLLTEDVENRVVYSKLIVKYILSRISLCAKPLWFFCPHSLWSGVKWRVAAVERLPVLHHSVDYILISFEPIVIFVSVEILRPIQPNGVMSSAVSLP